MRMPMTSSLERDDGVEPRTERWSIHEYQSVTVLS
jgi:hypothetical protein